MTDLSIDQEVNNDLHVSPELSLGNWMEWHSRALRRIRHFLKSRERKVTPGNWKALRDPWGGLFRGRLGHGRVYIRFSIDESGAEHVMILALGPKADYTDDATRGTMNHRIGNILNRYVGVGKLDEPQYNKFIPLSEMAARTGEHRPASVAKGSIASATETTGRAASLWGTRLWAVLWGTEHGEDYRLFAPGVAFLGAVLWGGMVGIRSGSWFALLPAPWVGGLYGLIFVASHIAGLTPVGWRPETQVVVDWGKVSTMAALYASAITLTLWGIGGSGLLPLAVMGFLMAFVGLLLHGFFDGWFDSATPPFFWREGHFINAMRRKTYPFSCLNRDCELGSNT